MRITYGWHDYNPRRYSKPWIARVTGWSVGSRPAIVWGNYLGNEKGGELEIEVRRATLSYILARSLLYGYHSVKSLPACHWFSWSTSGPFTSPETGVVLITLRALRYTGVKTWTAQ